MENLLVKNADTFKIIAASWFKTNDLINQAVRLVGQIGNILLSLNFLFDIS